jgi:hypothetical protein
MEIYLNDCSFHEQFYDRQRLEEAFRVFVGVLNVLQGLKVDYTFYREPHLPYRAIRDELLTASMHRLREKSLTQLIFDTLNRIEAANWRENPVHSTSDAFACDDLDVRETSMAEIAERKLRNQQLLGTLINFPNSRYSPRLELDVIKNGSVTSRVACAENRSQLADWLKEVLDLGTADYDYNSTRPPDDCQTVLRDVTRFQKTGQFQQGRRVHLEIRTRRYWYVDHFHYGHASHLEVFDARGLHVGESNLEGIVDASKLDREKKIDL